MNFINLLYGFSPVLVGALIGAFWQVLVVFGLHGMLIGVCMFNIFNGGGDMILAISIFICLLSPPPSWPWLCAPKTKSSVIWLCPP